jgi:hypothetical protein
MDRACSIEICSPPAGEARVVNEQVDATFHARQFADGGFDGFIAGHVEGQ